MRPLFSRRTLLGAGLAFAAIGAGTAKSTTSQASPAIRSDVDASALHASKATPLGLYLTPIAAHRALTEDPDILFIDVRDPIEVTFVGHAEGIDKIIPLGLATRELDPETGQYRMVANDGFVANVNAFVAERGKTKSDPIFVSCRSGSRSAAAVRLLSEAGYTNVWNIVEGFEGDSAPDGTRALNGWRNAGLPWGYKLAEGICWEGQAC